MVISGDFDGLLSAAYLSHLSGWKVGGFYNFYGLWLAVDLLGDREIPCSPEELENFLCEKDVIFVDHDINSPMIKSIGHHMISWDRGLSGRHSIKASLNPNLARGFNAEENFERKYPFATIHLLCWACPPDENLLRSEDFASLLLYADSSILNALVYQENALEWVDWLQWSTPNSPLFSFCRALLRLHPSALVEKTKWIADVFRRQGMKGRGQKGLPQSLLDTTKTDTPDGWSLSALLPIFQAILEVIQSVTGWSLLVPDRFRFLQLNRRSLKSCSKTRFVEITTNPATFSFAIPFTRTLNFTFFLT